MSNNDLEKMTFEEAIKELERLVDSLDKGDVSLDEAIAAYDRGSQLKDYCQNKLNEAKMKVETIQSTDNIDTIPEISLAASAFTFMISPPSKFKQPLTRLINLGSLFISAFAILTSSVVPDFLT